MGRDDLPPSDHWIGDELSPPPVPSNSIIPGKKTTGAISRTRPRSMRGPLSLTLAGLDRSIIPFAQRDSIEASGPLLAGIRIRIRLHGPSCRPAYSPG